LAGWQDHAQIYFFGSLWDWQDYLFLWSSISMAVSFWLTRALRDYDESDIFDDIFDQFFSGASLIYIGKLTYSFVSEPWLSPVVLLEGLGLLALSHKFSFLRF